MNIHPLSRLGNFCREVSQLVLAILTLTIAGVRNSHILLCKNRGPLFWTLFSRNFKQVGVQSVFFISLISALLGFFVIGRAYTFAPAVANYTDYYAELFIIIVMREVGPLVCGILLIARSGVAITAEIGYLKLNNEFEALRSIGVDPKHLFLLPILYAFPLSLLVMFIVFFTVCLFVSNIAIAVHGHAFITTSDLLSMIIAKIDIRELVIMYSKAIIGGIIIGIIAIQFGSAVGSRFTDISRALRHATSYQVSIYLLVNVLLSSIGYT